MEIELTTIEGEKITLFNVDYVKQTKMLHKKKEDAVSIVSSGGDKFEVIGSAAEIKSMIRESNMREVSLMSNL